MNKFSGPINGNDDSDYRLVVDKIRDLVEKIQKGNPLEQADGWMRKNHYSKEKIEIRRLSGDSLPMERCYINLVLVEMKREDNSKSQALHSPTSLSKQLNVEAPHEDLRVELSNLFSRQTLSNGDTKEPRRILIRGRAGVGKTTLCKRIVHDFTYKGAWSNMFNRLVWIPLRRLKPLQGNQPNLGDILKDIFFRQHVDGSSLSDGLWQHLERTKSQDTLFLLDGLDEVSEILNENVHGNSRPCHELLMGLLNRPNVIITTRPHTKLPSRGFQQPDIELDTIGFRPKQVQEYITKVLDDSEKAKGIQSYLQAHRRLQSLVQIPILLDAFCMTWGTSSTIHNRKVETMTAVYELISQNLWKKDILRLGQREASIVEDACPAYIEYYTSEYSIALEYLAFSGLVNDVIEFQRDHINTLHRHIKPLRKQHSLELPLDKIFGSISFLRTSDGSGPRATKSYHFMHLTFQEYFAAKYFVRMWKDGKNLQNVDFRYPRSKPVDMSCEDFFQRHKYTARYQIMWRFVAGLLDAEGDQHSIRFFEAMERRPVDLLGPAHQRLVMHCLSEAVSFPDTNRANREAQLLQWMIFESGFSRSPFNSFASDPELPEQVFFDAFRKLKDIKVLKSVQYSGRRLSKNITSTLVGFLEEEEDKDMRRSAAKALMIESELSNPAMAALGRFLNNQYEDRHIRRFAAIALSKQPTLPEETITALERLVNDEHEEKSIQSCAIEALGNQSTPSKQVIDALLRSLKIPGMERSASEALSKQSTLTQESMTALVSCLGNKKQETRYHAGGVLNGQSRLSQKTVTDLKRLFKDDDDGQIRFSVGRDLGRKSGLSETMTTTLVELLSDDDWKVQCCVAAALGGRSTLSEVATKTINSTLVRLLAHQDKDVRSSAATALGYQSVSTETAFKALTRLLGDEDWNVRHSAAEALSRQSTLTDSVLVVLLETFKSHGGHHQVSAVEALGNQSMLSERAMMAFEKLLRAKDKSIRHAAARASRRHLMSDTATLTLVDHLKHEDSKTQDLAFQALCDRTNVSEPIIIALTTLLDSPDSKIQRLAADSLSKQSTLPQPTVTALIKLLKDDDVSLRLAAADVLSNQSILEESSLYLIKELLESRDNTPCGQRFAAALALRNSLTASDKAMTEFVTDENKDVESFAIQWLLRKSTLRDNAISDLVELLKDESSANPDSVARILDQQSMLSEDMSRKISAALVGLFTEVNTKMQLDVAKAVGQRPNLMDNMLEAISLSISSNTQAEMTNPMVYKLKFTESLYASLLYRSFNEQLSLYIDGDSCIFNLQSGIRTAVLENKDSFQTAVSDARYGLRSICQGELWAPLES